MEGWKQSTEFINFLNKTKINDLHKYLQHMEMNLSLLQRRATKYLIFLLRHTNLHRAISIIHQLNTQTALHKSPGLVYSVVEHELVIILLRKSIAEIPHRLILTNACKLYKRKMNVQINSIKRQKTSLETCKTKIQKNIGRFWILLTRKKNLIT